MSTFKNKNLKCNKILQNEKKSDHYNIIADKHSKIMENFENKKKSLPILKETVSKHKLEIESLMPENLNETIKKIKNQEKKLKEKISDLENGGEIKIIKKRKTVVHQDNDDTTKSDILLKFTMELEELQLKLEHINDIYHRNCQIRKLHDKIRELENEIYTIENDVEELNYFDDAFDLLHQYTNKSTNTTVKEIEVDLKNLSMLKEIEVTDKKHDIVDRYLQTINEQKKYKRSHVGKMCLACKVPKVINQTDSTFTCSNCGDSEMVIMDSDKPSYKDPINEVKTNTYKRINHCSELLNQSQGKEMTDIDDSLLREIVEELKILGKSDLSKITKDDIKIALKNIGKGFKSEHAVYIANKLNNIPVNSLPHDTVEIVKTMFAEVERTWKRYKDGDRKNFMNSSFVFHKIFELLGEKEEAKKWKFLKQDKLEKHDELWEKICNHLNWEYIPSE